MQTQLELARAGTVTPAMQAAARAERTPIHQVVAELAAGHAVLPVNPAHVRLAPQIVGRLFRTKVNANIGRSIECSNAETELAKLKMALTSGADCIMDLSVGPDLADLRKAMLAECAAPFGTVPIYEAVSRMGGAVEAFDPEVLRLPAKVRVRSPLATLMLRK